MNILHCIACPHHFTRRFGSHSTSNASPHLPTLSHLYTPQSQARAKQPLASPRPLSDRTIQDVVIISTLFCFGQKFPHSFYEILEFKNVKLVPEIDGENKNKPLPAIMETPTDMSYAFLLVFEFGSP